MAGSPRYDEVVPGTGLPVREFAVTRADLVIYAGVAGDANPVHWNERSAAAIGLPDVIAHGALTMALAARALTDWAGDPGAVIDYGVRFARPVVVPDDGVGARVVVEGVVARKLDGRRVRVDLTVTCGPDRVLTRARAVVALVG